MKTLVLIGTSLTLTASAVLAQGYEQMPNGQTVYIPQRQHIPARPYYSPQGGPPLGTVTEHNGIQTYIPYIPNNSAPMQGQADEE